MYGYVNMPMFPGFFMFIFCLMLMGFLFFYFSKKENTKGSETALDILKKRLAKGEITLQEYEELKKTVE
ncbi:hypothetical protein CRU98_01635 [Arcobacter sp. CECT 8986]|uniref:SHOCT domain-containing protein n=1 Tax=Arcobacter sp. CECT 8986 TaxID=2044507 RepID=UPI001009EE09|nr:SHOCT domain-containing protein [Arcobacter sp. CECT 8986]RXK01177.1 hypothetical protein CRU98_01635 [Arcobacter sp. CECT 8986]